MNLDSQPSSRLNGSTELKRFVCDLAQQLPCFKARAQDIQIIKKPNEFYQTLLDMISKARHRIFIASLYIGKEEHELITALHRSLKSTPTLHLTIVVDCLRSTREDPQPSSGSILASLKTEFPNQVEIALFHTSELFGWRKSWIPRRFDEGWGLQHMKVYGVDDHLIMSGANLSHDYFTNRMDRYIKISNHSLLADYFHELCKTTAQLSYTIDPNSTPTNLSFSWPKNHDLQRPDHSKLTSTKFKTTGHHKYQSLTQKWKTLTSDSTAFDSQDSKVYIFPVLQIGPFEIRQETRLVVPELIRLANTLETLTDGCKVRLDWTSGYFSILRDYKRMLLESNLNVSITSASPEANGFYQSKGVSKYIPDAYTYLESLFYQDIIKARKQDQIQIREWIKEGWTYHAKGIWLSRICNPNPSADIPTDSTHLNSNRSISNEFEPFLTMIGSSNYGRRSAERDLECNLLIIDETEEKGVSNQLTEELTGLRKNATGLVCEDWFEGDGRQVGLGVKLATRLIRNML
ncbi:uncharacterized protein MELLADRAFT_103410 [Melampsora larici-populina 98AG31]|uniref:CDP-diacylglycerol--glycerol-3-phosphate 3-phosphatidyltransferase n=1 Tax=Melampsora larici-populina (strain 98AG31 / pathotype 3-4-7) TaxID=747676 RepID=F4RBD7_MELLP|nr:uncharacterized protein MELLADRAFT_103410 [Melampsora larici-populina 98AG31]EGG10378.1 hypothetical protein MELLADRAFT_103410 [Melampsora larici-populina 98AG31]